MNGTDGFLDIHDSHLRVLDGNIHAKSIILDQLDITSSNTTSSTVQFLNGDTAFKTTANVEIGTANLFVDTSTSNVGILTSTPTHTLDVRGTANVEVLRTSSNIEMNGGTFSLGGHMIPSTNEQYDIGSAEYKIRDMYVSDNSLWIGDKAKISFDTTEDKLTFRKRKVSDTFIPAKIIQLATAGGIGDDTTAITNDILNKLAPGNLGAMKLHHWLQYAKGFEPNIKLSDIFDSTNSDYDSTSTAGNVHTHTVEFTNPTTSIVASGNVEVGGSITGTLDVSSTRTGFSTLNPTTNEATLMISCTDDQAADQGDIGGGVVFRQRWNNPSEGLVPTGGIYGYKDRNSGSYGGGLLFTRCPDGGTGGALSEAMRITKEGNVVIGTTQIMGGGDIKFSTHAYTGVRHATATTNSSGNVNINLGKLYRGDNSGAAGFVTYSPVWFSNYNALNAVGIFKFTQVKVRGTGTQMRAVTDFYSYDSSTVSLSINGSQETIISISNGSANRSYMAVVHFVNTGTYGL